MSIQDDVKVLGRTRARDMKALALHKQVDALIVDIKRGHEIDFRACLVPILETCSHLLEKDAATQSQS
jgi:hypothetical protein